MHCFQWRICLAVGVLNQMIFHECKQAIVTEVNFSSTMFKLPTHPCIQSYLSNYLPRLIFYFSSTECSTTLILLYASVIGKVSALPLLQHLKMKELCPEFHERGRDCLRLKLSPGDTLPVPSMILDERMSYWEVSTTWWEKVEWLRIYSTCKFLQFFFRKYSHKLKWEFKMWNFQK